MIIYKLKWTILRNTPWFSMSNYVTSRNQSWWLYSPPCLHAAHLLHSALLQSTSNQGDHTFTRVKVIFTSPWSPPGNFVSFPPSPLPSTPQSHQPQLFLSYFFSCPLISFVSWNDCNHTIFQLQQNANNYNAHNCLSVLLRECLLFTYVGSEK